MSRTGETARSTDTAGGGPRRTVPTLEEVAARAGVGRGTASRVINGSPRVSDRTRAAVEQAVADLGYIPNRAARALAAGSADAVALVLPEPGAGLPADPYFADLVRGVGSGLADSGLQLQLTLLRGPEEGRRCADQLAARRVDGVLLVSVHDDDPLPGLIAELGVPAVLTGRRPAGLPLTCVDSDDTGGARTALGHLLARGRRTVAVIAGPPGTDAARRLLDGCRQALGSAPDAALVERAALTGSGGRRAMRALLDRRPGLDAVLAASDAVAAGALQVLRARGRRVPADVAVAGFDDSAVARHTDPPLTTVRRPTEAVGRTMAAVLLSRIQDPAAPAGPRIVLPTELIVRESS
ncbi:LacI family DNA-binding transcriptional regulator [Streptomyces sp. NPDC002536]